MKGTLIPLEFLTKEDETTGARVTRLTDNDHNTYHPYFTVPLMTQDGQVLLVGSDRTGSWQLYAILIKEKKLLQLTDEPNVDVSRAVLDGVNRKAYYISGNTLMSVDLDSLETREHLSFPEDYDPSYLSITNDGNYIAFSIHKRQNLIAPGRTERKKNVDTAMHEKMYWRPHSMVLRYNTQTYQYQTVWGEHEWISHTNISPVDPDIILFGHVCSWQLVQRMWIARVSTDEIYPLVEQRYNLDRVGHEFFTAKGTVGAQFFMRHSPNVPFYLEGDLFVNVDGSNEMRYFYPYHGAQHVQLNHATDTGVGDHAQIRLNQDDYRDYIALTKYDSETFRVRVGLLCKHASSRTAQCNHPHPFFTPDDRHVVYSSDVGGNINVYLAEADWSKTIKNQ